MKKQMAMICAAAMAISFSFSFPLTADAAGSADIQLRMVADRSFVSAAELENGDVTITAAVYLDSSTVNRFGSMKLVYSSDTDHIYFRNMVVGDNSSRQTSDTTYQSSQGTFTTSYVPYCFGYLQGSQNRYMTGSPMITTNQWEMDPIYGSLLYSAGENRVQFTADNGNLVTCDVTVDEAGTGHYSYTYTERGTNLQKTREAEIPRYDASIPAYDASDPSRSLIPGSCNRLSWLPGTAQLKNGAAFFGNTSDEFPFCYVDIVIEQGTPAGIYTVDFDLDECEMFSASSRSYTLDSVGTTIAVGTENVTVTSAQMDRAAYYFADDTTPIQAADFASSILADFVYPDATSAITITQNAEIIGITDCYGVTPKALFDAMSEDGCYISENAPLYCNGEILHYADGSNVTQKIMIGTKGDVNYDGKVDIRDAFAVLVYYAEESAGKDPTFYAGNRADADMETLTYFLADIDTESKNQGADGGKITITDSFAILQYYASVSAGLDVSWSEFRK